MMSLDRGTVIACSVGTAVFLALVICGVTFSVIWTDPHYLNRAGALIVAQSLLLTVWQFWYERVAESRRALAEEHPLGRPVVPDWTAWVRTGIGISSKVGSPIEIAIWRGRRVIFGTAIGFGIFGEILHGWGDVIIRNWIPAETRDSNCECLTWIVEDFDFVVDYSVLLRIVRETEVAEVQHLVAAKSA